MNLDRLRALAARWREEAELYRRRSLESQAGMAESFAADLETALREWNLEALSLDAAADESDYSYSALQKKVASGEIPNAGNKGSPRIRRCDLPRKAGRRSVELGGPDLANERMQEHLT